MTVERTLFGKAAVVLVLSLAGTSDLATTNHDWGWGLTFAECTRRGFTDYGRKTG